MYAILAPGGKMKSTEITATAERSSKDRKEASAFISEMDPFIRKVASRYMFSSFDEDIYSVSQEGFFRAIVNFDYNYGGFIPYAKKSMEIEIRSYLSNETRLIRIPRYAVEMARRVKCAKAGNPRAGSSQIMETAGIKSERTYRTITESLSIAAVSSLDSPINEKGETLSDVVASNGNVEEEIVDGEIMDELWLGINRLDATDRDIIIHLFGLGGEEKMSLSALASKHGVSKVTIQNRKKKALGILKSHLLPLVT